MKGQRKHLYAPACGVGDKLTVARGDFDGGGSLVVDRSDDGEPNGGGGAGKRWPDSGVPTPTMMVQ